MIRAIFLLALSVVGVVSITALARIAAIDCGSCDEPEAFWYFNEWLWLSGTPVLFLCIWIFRTLSLVADGERFLEAVREAFLKAFQSAAMVLFAATSAAHVWYLPAEFLFGGRTLEVGRYVQQFGEASGVLWHYYGLG